MKRVEAERHVDEILAIAAFHERMGTPAKITALAVRDEFIDALYAAGEVEELQEANAELVDENESLAREISELRRALGDE